MTVDNQIMDGKLQLVEKLQKYQPDHHEKLINTNILQVKRYHLLMKNK